MDLYITDLDGTLLQKDAQVSKKTADILNLLIDQGVYITVATARSIVSAQTILQPLRLCLPFVLLNGIYIYDPIRKTYLQSYYLDPDSVDQAIDAYESCGASPLVYAIDPNGEEKIYYRSISNEALQKAVQLRLEIKDPRYTYVDVFPDFTHHHVLHVNTLDTKKRLDPVYQILNGIDAITTNYYGDVYYPNFYLLDALHRDANKKTGLRFIKNRLKPSRVIAFGDNVNDLPLFEEADIKIAVSNAHPLVKKHADTVIGSNVEDAVALCIQDGIR